MKRALTIAAMFALALPTLAAAQEHRDQHHPQGHPPGPPQHAVHPGPVHPGPIHAGPIHPGPIHAAGPMHPGVAAGPYVFHGHPYAWHHVHFARPWAYPPGFGYRLWAVGAILPPLFWAANSPYYYGGWAELGLPPPDPGFQYVQYGPDLLLVNVGDGQVVQVFPGAFY